MIHLSALLFAVFALLGATLSPNAINIAVPAPSPGIVAPYDPPVCPGCGYYGTGLSGHLGVIPGGTTYPTPVVTITSQTYFTTVSNGKCHIPSDACVQKKGCSMTSTIQYITGPWPGSDPPFESTGASLVAHFPDGSWEMNFSESNSPNCNTAPADVVLLITQLVDGEEEVLHSWVLNLGCRKCDDIEG